VQRALGDLQPEVAADLYDRGMILTGGGALLDGMPHLLQRETRLAVRLADDPRHACVHGLQQLFEDPLLLRRVARNDAHPLLDDDAGAYEV
jgi:rod shape-determining protein MreB